LQENWLTIDFTAIKNFVRAFLLFSAIISAPWQHWLAGQRVLIGKAMQLEKMDAANYSKIDAVKSERIRKNTLLPGKSLLNCGVHFQMRHRQSIYILSFTHEDDI
jgi:hypothetical protein